MSRKGVAGTSTRGPGQLPTARAFSRLALPIPFWEPANRNLSLLLTADTRVRLLDLPARRTFFFGGGINYWFFKRVGLRVDFRDYVNHYGRIGLTASSPEIRIGIVLR